MSRFLTLALAQFSPRKGEYAENLARLGEWFARADASSPRPRVLHLPETTLTGYFVEGAVRELARPAGAVADDLDRTYRLAVPAAVTAGRTLDVVVGFYERWQHTLYNSAAYISLGGPSGAVIHHVHRKMFLPTYGLFDEERFVERGHELRTFETGWGRAALLVCEDAWHSLTGTVAALGGAEVIFLSSAAPARGVWPQTDGSSAPATVARWDRLVRDIAEEHGVFVSYVNLVGTEGSKAFWGSSMLAGPGGDARATAPEFEEALRITTIDLDDITRVRGDVPLLADLRTVLPDLRRALDDAAASRGASGAVQRPNYDPAIAATDGSGQGAAAGVPGGGPAPLAIDGPLLERWLVQFIRDEFAHRGFERAVVGLSGGVDSAVTAFLAARALGREHVLGLRLPHCTSSPESLAHAQLVIDALDIPGETIDITPAVEGYLREVPETDPTRRGNVVARMRMIALFDVAARDHALPLGTGNKTERLFGYFTWHADDSPPVNPLGDLFKTQIWALARHLGVPDVIVTKPASADLIRGQTDEGDFGISYAKADTILNWLVSGYTCEELVVRGFDRAEVELVQRRVDTTHWKRRLPTVAMVSPTAIGESYLRPVDY